MQTDNTTRDHKDVFTKHRRDRRAVTTLAGAPNQARSPAFSGALVGTDPGRACLPPAPVPLVKKTRAGSAIRPCNTRSEFVKVWGGGCTPRRVRYRPPLPVQERPRKAGLRCAFPSARPHSRYPLRYVLAAACCRPPRPRSALFGPARLSSASLGPARLPSPQLLSPRPTHLGSGRLRSPRVEFAMWTPGAYCKAIRVGSPVARLSAALCVWCPPRSPGLPRPPGTAPSFSRGLPREGEGQCQRAEP